MRVIRHDDAHQGAVFGRDVFVVESYITVKSENIGVEIRPLVHLAGFYIADDVVDLHNAAIISRNRGCRKAR